MEQWITRKILRQEVLHTFCNKCGEEIKSPCSEPESVLAKIFATWGYGSPRDGEDHLAHLCETCYDTFIETWKIPPTIVGEKGLL